MAEVTLAILGLERLGTSFGLALKRYMGNKDARHAFTILGFDQRGYNGKKAKQLGAVDNFVRGELDAVQNAHVVVLTMPYYQVKDVYEIIGPNLKPGTVILDTSPLKTPSIEWARANLPHEPEIAAFAKRVMRFRDGEMVGIDENVPPADADAQLLALRRQSELAA